MPQKISSLKTKRVTIDDLATMVNNGFKESAKNLTTVRDELIEKIDGVDRSLTNRINSLETTMNIGIKGLQAQIDNMAINHVTIQEHKHLSDRVKKV